MSAQAKAIELLIIARHNTATNISTGYDEDGKPFLECGVAECPKCGAMAADYDGFGMIRCVCEFCAHPSRTGNLTGSLRCDICGNVESEPITKESSS